MLKDRIPGMDFNQLRKIVDSSGNMVASKVINRELTTIWINYNKAEKTLANLINIRRAIILDDEGRLRPRLLYKVLPFIRHFDATDLKDKIYGTFGVVSPSVHQSVQVSYDKSVAEVYRDAITYMLR
jgi:hypothetical protein